MWFTIIYYHMFPRKIVLTNIKITRKSWSKYLNTLESILSFTFCFHKILWSSKCTSNMFILNFLDFLEVQECLQEFFTDRKLFKSSLFRCQQWFRNQLLAFVKLSFEIFKILIDQLLLSCNQLVAVINLNLDFLYWI